MIEPSESWDGALVRTWLERRFAASKLDQAAAEEWVCTAPKGAECTHEQAAFARRLKDLIAQDAYQVTGIHDDVRFERHVRGHLGKLARMTRANEGFGKTLHYQ